MYVCVWTLSLSSSRLHVLEESDLLVLGLWHVLDSVHVELQRCLQTLVHHGLVEREVGVIVVHAIVVVGGVLPRVVVASMLQ